MLLDVADLPVGKESQDSAVNAPTEQDSNAGLALLFTAKNKLCRIYRMLSGTYDEWGIFCT